MILAGRPAKILLIDTNVYFSKRLSDALKREGFDVTCSTQPSFALTTIEYEPPTAIVCSTSMREMGALDIARMVRADAKNSTLPVIALGDGSQRALMEAFQAGCDDYIDRTRPPAVIATHVRNIIISKAEGFQPTQMLPQSDTSLSGSLTHHDLPGVMQMLGHAHQTGALHINSGNTDALLFFDAGEIVHAECGTLFGDEAVIHILKSCMRNNAGVYKFVYGSASPQRTVLRSATDLMLDAMREIDESMHAGRTVAPEDLSSLDAFAATPTQLPDVSETPLPAGSTTSHDSPFASLEDLADAGAASDAALSEDNVEISEEHSAIAASLDKFAASVSEGTQDHLAEPPLPEVEPVTASAERSEIAEAGQSAECVMSPEAPSGEEQHFSSSAASPNELDEVHTAGTVGSDFLSSSPDASDSQQNSGAETFANYSIVPFFDTEENP